MFLIIGDVHIDVTNGVGNGLYDYNDSTYWEKCLTGNLRTNFFLLVALPVYVSGIKVSIL